MSESFDLFKKAAQDYDQANAMLQQMTNIVGQVAAGLKDRAVSFKEITSSIPPGRVMHNREDWPSAETIISVLTSVRDTQNTLRQCYDDLPPEEKRLVQAPLFTK